ncbi:MAG: thiolase family protein [Armatimonadota bacterium]|nr:MAG: thiolase family protein [Armatimonadota bacterium]
MHRVLEEEIVILSAARTPVGHFRGVLSDFDAVNLGGFAIEGAVERSGLGPDVIDTVNMGLVVSAGLGEAPGKAAAVRAGLLPEIHSRTVDTVCGSAMDAIVLGIESLLAGTARVVVAGGMESRSSAPYLVGPKLRRNTEHGQRGEWLRVERAGAYRWRLSENAAEQLEGTGLVDPTSYDGLFWPAERKFMRQYAVDFAARRGHTAEMINGYAAESHRKARRAREEGLFEEEIVEAGGAAADELRSEEWLARALAEGRDDVASAYNSSAPADAAAALVVTRAECAEALGVEPIARVLGYARIDGPPGEFLSAPARAGERLLAGLKEAGRPGDFTIAEANEAFAMQVPMFEKAFGGMEINVHGGAVAMGHPLGAAGARILTTLLYAMGRYGHRRGLATICYGGGGGYAMAVERLV